jgi:hypothetical protein
MVKHITTGKNFLFEKVDTHEYVSSYNLENSRIMMAQIINMEFFKVCSELNSNNYDIYDFEIINHNEAIIFALIKNIFKEITTTQQYYCFRVKLEMTNEAATFTLTPDFKLGLQMLTKLSGNKKIVAQHLPIQQMKNVYKLISQNKVHFEQHINFNDGYQLNFITETILGMVFKMASKKIIKFVKEL